MQESRTGLSRGRVKFRSDGLLRVCVCRVLNGGVAFGSVVVFLLFVRLGSPVLRLPIGSAG